MQGYTSCMQCVARTIPGCNRVRLAIHVLTLVPEWGIGVAPAEVVALANVAQGVEPQDGISNGSVAESPGHGCDDAARLLLQVQPGRMFAVYSAVWFWRSCNRSYKFGCSGLKGMKGTKHWWLAWVGCSAIPQHEPHCILNHPASRVAAIDGCEASATNSANN